MPTAPCDTELDETSEMEWWSDTRNVSMLAAWWLNTVAQTELSSDPLKGSWTAYVMYAIFEHPERIGWVWSTFQAERDAATSSMLDQ